MSKVAVFFVWIYLGYIKLKYAPHFLPKVGLKNPIKNRLSFNKPKANGFLVDVMAKKQKVSCETSVLPFFE